MCLQMSTVENCSHSTAQVPTTDDGPNETWCIPTKTEAAICNNTDDLDGNTASEISQAQRHKYL